MTDAIEREIRIAELAEQIRNIEAWIAESRRHRNGLFKEREALKAGISIDDRPKKVTVTDHAICRYVERVMGFNRHGLETKVFPQSYLSHVVDSYGSQEVQIGNTHSVIIDNNIVVTVLTAGQEY